MVEKIDFASIEQLSPDKRFQVLKRLIEELKEDIKQKQLQMETAVHMLKTTQREIALIEKVEIPKAKEVKIEELFKPEEKNLEARAREMELRLREDILATAQKPIEEIYQELKEIYQQQRETGVETEEQRIDIYIRKKGLEEKKRAQERGEYKPSEKAAALFTATEELIKKMYET